MTNLVVDTKTVHSVDYSDFEQFVKDYYGVDDYSFTEDAECYNDIAITLHSMKKSALTEYEYMTLQAFRTSGSYCGLYRSLLQDMINNDMAPEGDYVIEVSW